MKQKPFFPHDFNAQSDDKIQELISIHGYSGYGWYWAIVEELYNNENLIKKNYKRISFKLRISEEESRSLIEDFNLFSFTEESISSASVGRRLKTIKEKSEKARISVSKRTDRNSYEIKKEGYIDYSLINADLEQEVYEGYTNVEQTYNDSETNENHSCNDSSTNRIEEKRIEEKREKNKKETKEISLSPFISEELNKNWQEWIQYLREIKKAPAPTTVKKHIDFINSLTVEEAIHSIQKSIFSRWQGLFKPKDILEIKKENIYIPYKPRSEWE